METRTIRWLLVALLATAGCASTQVTERDEYRGGKLPRPGRILVHDFAVTAADLPRWSEAYAGFALAAEAADDGEADADAGAAPTPEQLEEGRALGTLVAKELVAHIVEMGLPAVRAAGQPYPRENDLAIVGYFGTIDEGSALKRVVIGFGSGGADLTTHVEGYRMTGGLLRKLGSAELDSGAGKLPGVFVPAIVTIATANPIGLAVGGAVKATGEVTGSSTIEGTGKRTAEKIAEELRPKFEEQGWIE
jgi:hypothetical protein